MPSKREFIAIGLPESVRNYLADFCDPSLASIRWIPKENFHLTMRFLGDISEEQEEKLRRLLRAINVSPFTLEIGSFGTFPSKGPPKVIWMGLGTGHPLLFQLRQKIDDAVLQAGIDCEMRDFVPHITLGRCPSGNASEIKALTSRADTEHGPIFSVPNFSLFESRRAPQGTRYPEYERSSLALTCVSFTHPIVGLALAPCRVGLILLLRQGASAGLTNRTEPVLLSCPPYPSTLSLERFYTAISPRHLKIEQASCLLKLRGKKALPRYRVKRHIYKRSEE